MITRPGSISKESHMKIGRFYQKIKFFALWKNLWNKNKSVFDGPYDAFLCGMIRFSKFLVVLELYLKTYENEKNWLKEKRCNFKTY